MWFGNAIYRVIHKRNSIMASFAEHPELSKINEFYTFSLGKKWQIKIRQLESGHYTFLKCYIQGASWKMLLLLSRSIHYFEKKWLLHMQFGLIVANQNQKLKRGHYTFWKCSLQDAPRKKQYHCFFRGAPKISRINNFYTYTLGTIRYYSKSKKIKIKKKIKNRTLFIFKILYTGCSKKEAILLLLSRST